MTMAATQQIDESAPNALDGLSSNNGDNDDPARPGSPA
jgi:hypothetical protein